MNGDIRFIKKVGMDELEDRCYSTSYELFLEHDDLDDFQNTVSGIEDGYGSPASVHTPWDYGDNRKEEFRRTVQRTDQLAAKFSSRLVVHNPGIPETVYSEVVEPEELECTPYLEHQAGTGFDEIYNGIISYDGAGLTLDTAHLYLGEVSEFKSRERSEEEFLDNLKYLLGEYGDQTGVIHLTDADLDENMDGKGVLGEGDLPLTEIVKILEHSGCEAPVIVEVMPSAREDSWKNLRDCLGPAEGSWSNSSDLIRKRR